MLMSKEREQENAIPERWSAKAKSEGVVLRPFSRGECRGGESGDPGAGA
jgi:hypothetical protein